MKNQSGFSRRNFLLTAASVGGSVALPSFLSHAQSPSAIRIGEGTVPDYTHFYVADTLNLWAKANLVATPTMFAAGRLAVDALLAGKVDIATSAETPVMFAAANGLPIRVIATVITYQPFDLIAGPRITSTDNLKGKKIAYAQGTNAHFYLNSLLSRKGLAWADISGVNMQVGDFVPSLISGAVDGFVWSEPLVSAAMSKDDKIRRLHSEGLYHTYGCVSALQATIDQSPDLLVKALKALMAADGFIKSEPEKAQKILADTIKLDPTAPAKFWKTLDFGVKLEKARLIADLTRQAKWAFDNRITKPEAKMPDFSSIVVSSIFDTARS